MKNDISFIPEEVLPEMLKKAAGEKIEYPYLTGNSQQIEEIKSGKQIELFDFNDDGDVDITIAGINGGVSLLRNEYHKPPTTILSSFNIFFISLAESLKYFCTANPP